MRDNFINKVYRKRKQLLKIIIIIIKLENEIVIFEIVFGLVHGWPYQGFQKIPQIPIPITCRWNFINVSFFFIMSLFVTCQICVYKMTTCQKMKHINFCRSKKTWRNNTLDLCYFLLQKPKMIWNFYVRNWNPPPLRGKGWGFRWEAKTPSLFLAQSEN